MRANTLENTADVCTGLDKRRVGTISKKMGAYREKVAPLVGEMNINVTICCWIGGWGGMGLMVAARDAPHDEILVERFTRRHRFQLELPSSKLDRGVLMYDDSRSLRSRIRLSESRQCQC